MLPHNRHQDGHGNTRLIPEPSLAPSLSVISEPLPAPSLSAHCDYLRVSTTVPLASEDFIQLLEFVAPAHAQYVIERDKPWSAGPGATYFTNRIRGVGFVGGFNKIEREYLDDSGDREVAESYEVMLDFQGEYWEAISNVDMWRKIRGLKYRFKMVCNRIDPALDDSSYKLIPVDQMRSAYDDGDIFRVRKYKVVESRDNPGAKPKITHYYGSRESGKYIRIYDHDGECLRMEVEFKRGFASKIFDIIADLERGMKLDVLNCIDAIKQEENNCNYENSCMDANNMMSNEEWEMELQKLLGALVVGAIDFREKSKVKNSSKACVRDTRRLDFWQEFIDKVGTFWVIRVLKKGRTLLKTLAWLWRQASSTIAMLKVGLGAVDFDWYMSEIVGDGFARMNKWHELQASLIKEDKTIVRLNYV